ncbi:hypothetical protein ACHHYP_09033 [Achlya hypogyna]|uniref:PX domain-containing protein n=1 Tax=Achlya hypogyna TaxID=1202772 RepID=A0A1V9ZJV6_ACHHY|nr:hypothetical protein ACHHYP_09033 [Achlya hypogyna]
MPSMLTCLAPWSKAANALNHVDHVALGVAACPKRPVIVLFSGPVVWYTLDVYLRTSLAHLAHVDGSRNSRRSRVDSYALQLHRVQRRFSDFYKLCTSLNDAVTRCGRQCMYCYQVLSVLDDTLFPHRGVYWVQLRRDQLSSWLQTVLTIARQHPGQFEARCEGCQRVLSLLAVFLDVQDLM